MSQFSELTLAAWGHAPSLKLNPSEIADRLVSEVCQGIKGYRVVAIEREDDERGLGYERVYVNLDVTPELFDAFLNGPCGYRAQYFANVETGKAYNRMLLERIASVLIQNTQLCSTGITEALCKRSLCGDHTKFWFPKEITSPGYEDHLLMSTITKFDVDLAGIDQDR